MQIKFQIPAFLTLVLILAISHEGGTVTEEPCDEQLLLFRDDYGIEKFCPKTNVSFSITLSDGRFTSNKIAHSSRDGGKIAVILGRELRIFVQTNSRDRTFSQSITAPLPKIFNPDRPSDVYQPDDMAVNWMTETAYLAYGDRGIVAYDLNNFKFANVHECNEEVYELSVVNYPTGGLLVWVEHDYIRRSFLDGTEKKTLTKVDKFGGHAVDKKTLLVFWTEKRRDEILRCDMDGNNRRVFKFSAQGGLNRISVLNNIIYYQEAFYHWKPWKTGTVLYRADVKQQTKQLVYNGTNVLYLEILPDARDFEDSDVNPCANNSCSHMCVQSSRKMHSCLCPEGYVVHRESGNCTAQSILVSTAKGISIIPFVRYNPDQGMEFPSVNSTDPFHVQCDYERRRIYWVQQDKISTRIMSADLGHLDKGHDLLYKWNRVSIRYPAEDLQAFALDWIFSNVYVVFRYQRRILVCHCNYTNAVKSENANNGCAELFGNRVATSIGGLALDPLHGVMYWAHHDSDDIAIVHGGMDGTWLKVLSNRGLRHPTSIAVYSVSLSNETYVYWVDSSLNRIEFIVLRFAKVDGRGFLRFRLHEKLVPQRIAIAKKEILVVGSNEHGITRVIYDDAVRSQRFIKMEGKVEMIGYYLAYGLSNASGLSTYGDKSQTKTRTTPKCGKGHPCRGICVPSGVETYQCLCPIGSERYGLNGSSWRELELPVVIYGGAQSAIVVKNGISTSLPSVSEGMPVAYDPVRREIIWYRGFLCYKRVCGTKNMSFSIYRQAIVDGRRVTSQKPVFGNEGVWGFDPFSCAYDWAGDNIYVFVESYWFKGVVVISKDGYFTTVFVEEKDSITPQRVSLDPSTGRMYWLYRDEDYPQNTGIWRCGMDGSEIQLITPRIDAGPWLDLLVDHSSRSIFWVESMMRTVLKRGVYQILRCNMDGENVRKVIGLQQMPGRLHVVGDRLFWTSSSGKPITSCHKETGNNLMTHDLHHWDNSGRASIIISPNPLAVQPEWHPCTAGKLCSHICVPTPAGYMRCLCPLGRNLSSDGWTCECEDPDSCDNDGKELSRRSPVEPTGRVNYGGICPGNNYSCAEICVEVGQVCNGIPNCPDYSDEGERCNDACGLSHGCLHTCIPSPKGPICVCLAGQMLDEDKKSCIVLRSEGGKWDIAGAVMGVAGLIIAVIITVGTFKYRSARRKLRDLTDQEVAEFLRGDPAGASTAPDGLDRALLLPYTHVISPQDITRATEKVLGTGEFGVVNPGIYKSQAVAIKTFKRSVETDEFKAVLVELKIMAYMGDHEFILKFIGADISEIAKRKLMIVTELSPNGDLLHCLWKVASEGTLHGSGLCENVTEGSNVGVTIHTLYKWCEQIASGMEYLTQKQIVHGDLATRNVHSNFDRSLKVLLFNDNKVANISDFGLSKQLYGCSTYQRKRQCKLPWRWAAVEQLTLMQFSEGSDVWAFAVTAWEIFSLGETPYKGTTYGPLFVESLKEGNRLAKPRLATDEIYKVLLECWDIEKSKRPRFFQLQQVLCEMTAGEMSENLGSTGHEENTSEAEYITVV